MSEKTPPTRYAIGFDPAYGPDHPVLTIIDRNEDPKSPLRIRHTSSSWETTAAHLAPTFDELDRLRANAAKLPDIIDEALDSYRAHHTRDYDGDGMLLCDVFSDPNASSVHYGLEEVALLKDHIVGAIIDSTKAAADQAQADAAIAAEQARAEAGEGE